MNGLTADVDIDPTEDLFGYTVDDLQSDIEIVDDAITGTLKYIADYSSAFVGDEASGNYIVLHFSVPEDEDASITAEIVNGVHGPITLDADGLLVARIADKDTQTIKVVASKEGFSSVTKIYNLTGLTCETE